MSVILNEVRRATYLDSIVLMRISRQIAVLPGIEEAGLIIGTPANKQILRDVGIFHADSETAEPSDLILALRASDALAGQAALAEARRLLDHPSALGATAAVVLTTPRHDGRTYVVTGPEAVTYARVAAELSAATGAEVEFVDIPDEAALHALVEAGLPDAVAQQLVNIFALSRGGVAEHVTSTVGDLTGRTPRGIAALRMGKA